MQIFTTTIAIGTLVSSVFAAPAVESGLEKRAGTITFCKEPGFQNCLTWGDGGGNCINVPGDFHDQITSIGPDGNLVCTVYAGENCVENQPKIDGVHNPGWSDLRKEVRPQGSTGTPPGGNWDNAIDSYRCWFT